MKMIPSSNIAVVCLAMSACAQDASPSNDAVIDPVTLNNVASVESATTAPVAVNDSNAPAASEAATPTPRPTPSAVASAEKVERRCGWLSNPTPGNFWLDDADSEWILSTQGGYQADGMDTMPDLSSGGWVETNGSYGYGCACVDGVFDAKGDRATRIVTAQPRPLAQCRADKALPAPDS